jgi:ElaA protein
VLSWHDRTFGELSTVELYAIVALRERVFVVEQRCAYLDADGVDPPSRHVWVARDGAIVGYLRIVPPATKYLEPSLGRIVTAPEVRGTGLGRELVRRGLERARIHYGSVAIRIGAQAHLERFYGEFGFVRASEVYDEDGIPHVEMIRSASSL